MEVGIPLVIAALTRLQFSPSHPPTCPCPLAGLPHRYISWRKKTGAEDSQRYGSQSNAIIQGKWRLEEKEGRHPSLGRAGLPRLCRRRCMHARVASSAAVPNLILRPRKRRRTAGTPSLGAYTSDIMTHHHQRDQNINTPAGNKLLQHERQSPSVRPYPHFRAPGSGGLSRSTSKASSKWLTYWVPFGGPMHRVKPVAM